MVALSAQDVHDKQFKLVRQATGYDIDEVDAFLDEVETEIIRLTGELLAAHAAVQGAAQAAAGQPPEGGASEGAAPEGGAASEDAAPNGGAASVPPSEAISSAEAEQVARILALAQRTADEYVQEARRTAEGMVARAEAAARLQVSALEAQRVELEGRVAALRTFEDRIRTRLTTYFETQLADLRATLSEPADAPSTD